MPEKLEKELAKFKECNENTALVFSDVLFSNDTECTVTRAKHTGRPEMHGNVYRELLKRDCVPLSVLIRTKYFSSVGGFDESMMTAEDYDAWLRLAEHYEFSHVNEPMYVMHFQYEREHVSGNNFRKVRNLEKIAGKHMHYLVTDKYVYWVHLRNILPYYAKCMEYKNLFTVWFKTLTLQPARIFSNISLLLAILLAQPLSGIKSCFRRNFPDFFFALKHIKYKLERKEIISVHDTDKRTSTRPSASV